MQEAVPLGEGMIAVLGMKTNEIEEILKSVIKEKIFVKLQTIMLRDK